MASANNIVAYTRNQPEQPMFPAPIIARRAPTTHDINYPLGLIWVDRVGNNSYLLTSVVSNTASWVQITAGVGGVDSLTTDDATVVLPAAGNINLAGDGTTIQTTGAGDTATIALVASPVISGGLTIGNGLTVNLGGADITGGLTTAGGPVSINATGSNNINIGATSNSGTIAIGNLSSGAVTVESGSTLDIEAADNISIFPSVAAKAISIGSTAMTGSISLGVSTAGQTINVGNAAAANIINIGNANAGNITNLKSPITALPGPVYIYTGSGAPSNGLALHVGDLYINTTAATAATRMYIATAASTWTNVTCAA